MSLSVKDTGIGTVFSDGCPFNQISARVRPVGVQHIFVDSDVAGQHGICAGFAAVYQLGKSIQMRHIGDLIDAVHARRCHAAITAHSTDSVFIQGVRLLLPLRHVTARFILANLPVRFFVVNIVITVLQLPNLPYRNDRIGGILHVEHIIQCEKLLRFIIRRIDTPAGKGVFLIHGILTSRNRKICGNIVVANLKPPCDVLFSFLENTTIGMEVNIRCNDF